MSETESDDGSAATDENTADSDGSTVDSDETPDSDGVAPVGVKLGSTRTVVVYPSPDGEGTEVVRTLTCLATYEDVLTGEERVLYGEEAATEYPDTVEFMLRSGLPEDDDSAEAAATFFSELLAANDVPEDSAVVYAIPTIDNEAGLANLEGVIERSSIGDELVRSYPESLCGSLPAFDRADRRDGVSAGNRRGGRDAAERGTATRRHRDPGRASRPRRRRGRLRDGRLSRLESLNRLEPTRRVACTVGSPRVPKPAEAI